MDDRWLYVKIDCNGTILDSAIVGKAQALSMAVEGAVQAGYGLPGQKLHRVKKEAEKALFTYGKLTVDEDTFCVTKPQPQKPSPETFLQIEAQLSSLEEQLTSDGCSLEGNERDLLMTVIWHIHCAAEHCGLAESNFGALEPHLANLETT